MSSLPPSPRSRASLARVAYGMQEELKARRIVCPADRGAARWLRLNSRLVARAHLGRSWCAPSPVRLRPAQPAGRQLAAGWRPTPLRHPVAEYAIHTIGTTARSAGPPRAACPGFHSGRGGRLDDYNHQRERQLQNNEEITAAPTPGRRDQSPESGVFTALSPSDRRNRPLAASGPRARSRRGRLRGGPGPVEDEDDSAAVSRSAGSSRYRCLSKLVSCGV